MLKNILLASIFGTGFITLGSFVFVGDNVNAYLAEATNMQIVPEVLEKDYCRKLIYEITGGADLIIKKSFFPYGNRTYLMKPREELEDFSLKFRATRKDYLNFRKEKIGISLFESEAWNNEDNREKYGVRLSSSEVENLFLDGLDEIKVKQLLLSLSTRRNWIHMYLKNFWDEKGIIRPSSLDDLKNLKIKYFRNFESLKNYVYKKVKSCTGEKRSCIAHRRELSIIDQDKLDFYGEDKHDGN